MRRLFALLLLSVSLPLCGTVAAAEELARGDLVRRTFLDGHVSMLVPRDFRVLPADEIRRSYPVNDAPDVVIADRNRAINITFQHTAVPMKPAGLPEFLERLRGGLAKRRGEVRIIHLGMSRWSGRSYMLAYLERPNRSRFGSSRIDNYTVGTTLKGELLLIAFNSDVAKRAVWASARERIIRSIRVRE